MANSITDNRTNVNTFDSTTGVTDLAGTAASAVDTEIFYQGSASAGFYCTTTRDGRLHNFGSAQNMSNNTFYLLVNCGIVGLLATKANGGLTVRFCGATVTNWFEVRIAGSDNWPQAFSGGWVQLVVDIEVARAAAVSNGWTNGTPPATSAIQYVGISAITAATMPRMADNTWLDQIARLPSGTAGILIQGRNGGSTDWNWADVVSAANSGKWGTCRTGPGGSVVLNTPVQFFVNDATTHAFTDTNRTLLWSDQEFIPDGFYGLRQLGAASGTSNLRAGIKTGTGDAATGAQGWSIQAASNGKRWFLDVNDTNIDTSYWYGCTIQHAGAIDMDGATVEMISTALIDCSSCRLDNSLFLRNNIVNANTADGVAFATTDDLSDIRFSTFNFSDGHAVQLTTPIVATQSSKGNIFTGYGAIGSNDAAVYNNAGGAVTINVTDGGSTPTYRNGASASTTVNNNKSVTFTGMKDNTEVRVYNASTGAEVAGIENAVDGTADNRSFTWSAAGGLSVNYVIHNVTYETIRVNSFSVPASDSSIPIQQRIDRNFANP